MRTPIYCRLAAYQLFESELASIDTSTGLFRAAFAIALHERPEASLAEAEAIIEQLAATVKNRVHSKSDEALLAHLHDVLFDVFGLHGNSDDYYNPANSYLPDVLLARRGLPITLVLVYKRVAELVGLVVHGINSPGHFMAEVESTGIESSKSMFVDPFFSGTVLTVQEAKDRIVQTAGQPIVISLDWLPRATHRQWLARMLMNLLSVFTATGQERNMLAMQELLELLEK
ncbi:transglutaminase family protein [Bythopirellula polymerisocia]|uniref:Protein SirB1 N-terminal domain-containing protein n=1 Tax=Bythopirellula polymerisocia TaxID=2528003 RepID=A0A5C6CJL8_9BACT|nr:transglutaminase-like domain-containing protein [Bythopirellula polymerisocia]TWU23541.1 hypothetical protein Pla144_37160 [Bythopirellula polymerisocia]